MRMGRLEFAVAILISALLAVTGIYLGLTKSGSDASTLGWIFALVGAGGLAVNLYLRSRLD
jgi:hypothetical protein